MPNLPRAWSADTIVGQPVLLDTVTVDGDDRYFGPGPSITLTWLPCNVWGTTTGGQPVMVSMTPLQASHLRDAIDSALHQSRRDEAARAVPASDPELERLLAEEEAIERQMRDAERQVDNPYPWAVVGRDGYVFDRFTNALQAGEYAVSRGDGVTVVSLPEPFPGPGSYTGVDPVTSRPIEDLEPALPSVSDEPVWSDTCACPDCREARARREARTRTTPAAPYGVRTSKVRPLP